MFMNDDGNCTVDSCGNNVFLKLTISFVKAAKYLALQENVKKREGGGGGWCE